MIIQNVHISSPQKTMTLSGVEFLRQFFLHLLPKGFVKIRSYGFLANRHRAAKLALCRELLARPSGAGACEPWPEAPAKIPVAQCDQEGARSERCACCGGRMIVVEERRRLSPEEWTFPAWLWNSS